ncbi:MAG: helix-turn-helix transcriptional regulator [Solimonas sp.]
MSELRRRVLGALPQGHPTIDAIAAQLGLSFQQLVEELRHESACRYLRQGHLPLTEIGYLLGYSEPSAFSRAFRCWSGDSPLAYRRRAAR